MYIGHDAEFVVLDKKGEPRPAHEFFPPKEKPIYTNYRTDENYHRDQIFRDGTSLEVNTPGMVTCMSHLLGSTRKSLNVAQGQLPRGSKIEAVSAYRIEEDLSKAPPDVLNSGCSPVRNAYEGGWTEKAVFMEPDSKWRFAGGHIHLSGGQGFGEGLKEKNRERFCKFVVRYLDLFLAVPIIYLDVEGKNGVRRRKVYGQAGEFRYQEYKTAKKTTYGWEVIGPKEGIEYRVLGPEWLRDRGLAALTMMLARSVAQRAANKFSAGKKMPGSELVMAARRAINEGDTAGIFRSKAFQKKFEAVLKASSISHGATIGQFEFMRKEGKELFKELTLNKYEGDMHNNWPECLKRWGWKE